MTFLIFGGHSLKVTRLINKIEEIKNIRLTVSEIFKARTAEKISELLESSDEKIEDTFEKTEEKDLYSMSPVQKRMYAIYQTEQTRVSYNEPIVLESHNNNIDIKKLQKAINKLIERHEIFRTTFHYENGEFVQKVHKKFEIKIECESKQDSLENIIKDFIRPFVLEELPLLRVKIIKQADRTFILSDIHHIIIDGKTVNNMFDEIISLYQGKELEPVKWQYKDYSAWINKKDMSKQKEYWKNVFKDDIPVLELPLDYNRGKYQSRIGNLLEFSINKDLKEKINKIAVNNKVTDYMVMLSAFMILLGKYSRQEDVVVGTPVSARTQKNTENMMGMFANTIALRGKPENKKNS